MLLGMVSMGVSALIASASAQNGPTPAEKKQADADNPFSAAPEQPVKPAAAKPQAKPAEEANSANDPFGGPTPAAKPAEAKPEAKPNAETDDADDPFTGPPPKGLRPFGKSPAVTVKVFEHKPAAREQKGKHRMQPLHGGEKAILKAMKEQTSLEFIDTPLQDVIDYLQDKHHIPIKLDTSVLKEAGVEPETQVTCNISGVPLRSALRLVLTDLQLKWVIWSDVVLITSSVKEDTCEIFMTTKIYDVSDLIVATQDKPYRGSLLPTADASEGPYGPSYGTLHTSGASTSGGTGGPSPGVGMSGVSIVPQENIKAVQASDAHMLRNFGVGAPAAGAAGPTDRYDGMEPLMNLITSTIATKTWDINGGTGTMSRYGSLLCISQSFEVQDEVQELLHELRAKRRAAPTVVVDLQWLWLDAAQYEKLMGGAKPAKDGRTRLTVDAKALKAIGRKVPGFRGRIACADGQLVHLASGDRRSLIVGAVPVVGGTDTGVGYTPVIHVPNVGVVVELRPTVAPGGTASIDVASTVTRWGKPQPTAILGASQSATAGVASCPVQRPNIPTQQLAATVRVPLGRPVVLGGLTFAPAESAGLDEATDDPVQLYLIATTSVAE